MVVVGGQRRSQPAVSHRRLVSVGSASLLQPAVIRSFVYSLSGPRFTFFFFFSPLSFFSIIPSF